MSRLKFELEASAVDSRARAGKFRTAHNEVLTPTFMPVGTHASVRGQRREDLLHSGAQVLLANTYHLLLRPGPAMFERLGGIHGFMNWPRSVLTDSGGFQIFSLPESRAMREDGAEFKSYVDGSTVRLTPESSIAMQRSIGSDIMMVLDQCVPATVDHDTARRAMELTHRWALRSLTARGDSPQALFGIVQGACYADLRAASAQAIIQMPFDGFAIGGLAVGETVAQREDCTATVTDLLPHDRPRYLMGVGTTRDLLEAVHRGVDMFDCILPTAFASQGVAFTSLGRRDLRRGVYQGMDAPLDPACGCHTCTTHSIAYLRHLQATHDSQATQLVGLHNISFYMQLMRTMREHILAGSWLEYYHRQRQVLDARDSYGPKANHRTKAERTQAKLKLGRYEILVREDIGRIRDTVSGEVMHSVNDPAEEARSLYVEQSRLIERLQQPHDDPLVVWDVGLGAAANAMATIHAVEALTPAQLQRRLQLVSFENDLDSLKLALRHTHWFPHLRHLAPNALLASHRWQNAAGSIEWLLLPGDFTSRKHHAPAPDLIFFDPFSFKTDSALWTLQAFRELARICEHKPTQLFTYTYSTRVRAALLAAGFFVAKGRATGPKLETTIALSPLAAVSAHGHELLDGKWLGKWARSDARMPMGAADAGGDDWQSAVSGHAQFVAGGPAQGAARISES
ncbi:MAG: tRNA guanosine(34) transglycosylase Tgt [Steroidobacteraceae bacterium]